MKEFVIASGVVVFYVAVFLLYIAPSIVAWRREHYYKWVIIALNIFFGMTAIGWVVALVWAAWPKNTPFFSILTNDAVTGESQTHKFAAIGNAGSAIGKGTDQEINRLDLLDRYVKLRDDGILTEKEFQLKKQSLLEE